ncbi:MAG: hypothetical protein ACFCAD_09155 [Pleurocapsa sp.]
MWLTATGIFLGTQPNFLEPIDSNISFDRTVELKQIPVNNFQLFVIDNYKRENGIDTTRLLVSQPQSLEEQRRLDVSSVPTFTIEKNFVRSDNFNYYNFNSQPVTFKSGVASWKTDTKVGSLKLDGNFNTQAEFTKGKAFWDTQTKIGSVNLNISVDNELKPIKSTAAWETDTTLGSLKVKGNFDRHTTFTGGNAAWNAQTKLGAIAIKGNFDEETTFTGGNAAWNAQT